MEAGSWLQFLVCYGRFGLLFVHSNFATGLRRLGVQVEFELPQRLPVHGADGQVFDAVFSSERGRTRQHLPGHPQRQVVGAVRRAHHPAVHSEPAGRPQQRQSAQRSGRPALVQPDQLQKATARKVPRGEQASMKMLLLSALLLA